MKTCRFILMVVIAAFAFGMTSVYAQEAFEPRETWPYIYENFCPGRLVNINQAVFDVSEINISVIGGEVHFIKDGVVMKADSSIMMAQIGNDTFMRVNGKFMRILKETEHGAVLQETLLDIEAMSRANIGYGNSAVATTRNVSPVALEGSVEGPMTSNVINKSLDVLKESKLGGKILPLTEDKYIVVGGVAFKATRYDFLMVEDLDKVAFKKYLKDNKVKFSKTEDLAGLAEFIYRQMTQCDE